jgi:hypothetical protein
MRSIVPLWCLLGAASLLLAAGPGKADSPKPAQEILAAAEKQAKAEHKAIFLHFSASW